MARTKSPVKITFNKSYQLYKRIWSYISEFKGRFLISIVAMVIAAATEPAFAHIMKPLIDQGFTQQNQQTIVLIPLLVVLIFFIRAIASYINDYMTNWLSGSTVEKMRKFMFTRLLELPVQYYDGNNSGRIMSRIIFDVTQITEAGFNIITITFKDGVTVLALLCLLFYTDWQLTLFCLFTLPFVLLLVRILSHKLRALSQHNQQQYGEMTQIVTEAIQGQKVIKLFSGNRYEQTRFDKSVNAIKFNNVKQAATASLNSGLSQFLVACALAMILYFAATKSKAHHFTAGEFVSFITAMIMIFAPMKRITSVTQSLQKGLTAAESVFSFLDIAPEQNQGTLPLAQVLHGIEFKNVNFTYHNIERTTIDQVSFSLHVGETLALVGTSGSGKTTLANLLARFYSLDSGAILIDGINIVDFDLQALRRNIALVSQDVILFNDTVANNIAYGMQDTQDTQERIIEAAKLANALDFIEHLPQGFSTQVGENGTRLSGGQKQRIAIARAIYKNAPILILDEATSALDNQAEKLVQRALDYLMQHRTTIVIAHRLSTVINADKIVVLEHGRIVETGTHEQLLSTGRAYANLYNLQLHH